MSSLSSLLRDADPIRREPPLPDHERDRLRQTILRSASVDRTGAPVRARLILVAAIGVAVMGFMALAHEVWVHGTTPVQAAVRFEVRLAEDQPMAGLIVAKVGDSDRLIYLHPEVVVSNDDIAQSWLSQDGPDRYGVTVQLLPAGAERMRQATTGHVGRPVAILIDGDVVIAPVVRSPIGESAVISGDYSRAEAERIADGMRLR